MYFFDHSGTMEKVQPQQYLSTQAGFTTEIEKGNDSYRKKLDQIKFGKSVYAIDKNVNKAKHRTLQCTPKEAVSLIAKGISNLYKA